MPYFLSPVNLQIGQRLDLAGEEAGHLLLSRRLRPGEAVRLQGPDGKRFLCEAVEVKKKSLTAVVKEQVGVPPEPKTTTTLFLAYISQAALDVVLQKTTELLAGRVVLFNSQNVAHALTRQKFEERQPRWAKILWEAAKQSERAAPPELMYAKDLPAALALAGKLEQVILLDPTAGKKLGQVVERGLGTLGLFVGPEGGLTQVENQQVLGLPRSAAANLGPVLLRAETAALAAVAISQDALDRGSK